jgi:hypothetical protein
MNDEPHSLVIAGKWPGATKGAGATNKRLVMFRKLAHVLRHVLRPRVNQGRADAEHALRSEDLARLAALGVHPDRLAGRLRLVLPAGCYQDFRFTRDILSTSVCAEQIDRAIIVLIELGAHCDCQVFEAVGQPPRGILWHHSTVT